MSKLDNVVELVDGRSVIDRPILSSLSPTRLPRGIFRPILSCLLLVASDKCCGALGFSCMQARVGDPIMNAAAHRTLPTRL